jgi:hypothetical protein
MSRIKEHYHDEICEGIRKMNEKSDEDYQYELFTQEQKNKELEKRAEEASFMKTFETTGSYPI